MTFDVMIFPPINAALNALATVLLLYGYYLIKQKRRAEHRTVMIAAFSVSAVFLACYLTSHYLRGGISTPFGGTGFIRPLYYTMLSSHIALAALVPVLAVITMNRGLRNRIDKHRKIARWTYPIWLYVSVTGVLVYFMLYQWFPAPMIR